MRNTTYSLNLEAHLFDKERLFYVYECLHGIPGKFPQRDVFEVQNNAYSTWGPDAGKSQAFRA